MLQRSISEYDLVRELLLSVDKPKPQKNIYLHKILEDGVSGDTILKITTHKRLDKKVNSEFVNSNLQTSLKKRRIPINSVEDERKRVASMSAPVPENVRKNINHLSGIRESVDPLFVDLKQSLRNVGDRIAAMQVGIRSSESTEQDSVRADNLRPQRHALRGGDHHRQQHIYRTTRHCKDIKIPTMCKNTQKGIDPNNSCGCDHCNLVGLLSEAHKHPIVPHLPEPKELFKKGERHRNSVGGSVDEKEAIYLNDLVQRVKILEARLEIQEDRAVPKDYFKRIITKIVSHFSAKIPLSSLETATCVGCSEDKKNSYKSRESKSPRLQYQINHLTMEHPLRYNTQGGHRPDNHKIFLQEHTSSNVNDALKSSSTNERFWKWGGEILKPGVDLKNKIMSLLEVTFGRFSKTVGNEQSAEKHQFEKNLNIHQGDDSNRFFNGIIKPLSNNDKQELYSVIHHDKKDTEVLKNKDNTRYKMDFERKTVNPSRGYANYNEKLTNKHVNVAYVNPKIKFWQDSSTTTVKADYEEDCSRNKFDTTRETEKQEFLRTLAKTKFADKERLWLSIWHQAKINGQTKSDKVTIQIPRHIKDARQEAEIVEIEFTIQDLQEMLIGE